MAARASRLSQTSPSPVSRVLFSWVCMLVAMGCGPSLRHVEQANEYFERCHGADRDARRTHAERRACWSAWQAHYEVGQAPDRVDYVRERLAMLDPHRAEVIALATADVSAEPEAAPPAEVERSVTGASTDTAPPEGPELSDTLTGRLPARLRRRPTPPRTRTSACAAGCEPAFVDCAHACPPGDRGCADACRHRYRQCARGCF